MPKNISYLFVLLSSLLWGSTAAVSKLLLDDLDSFQVLFFANLWAFVGTFAVAVFQGKFKLVLSYNKKDYFSFAWMGFLGAFLYSFFLYGALQRLSAQEAFIINYLWPVMVVVLAVPILGERLNYKKVLGIICSFLGVFVVITKGNFLSLHFDSMAGIVFAVSGAVTYGLFSVLGKRQSYEKFTSMSLYYLLSMPFALAAMLVFSHIPQISLYQFLGLCWLGAFTSGFAFVFWFRALEYGDTTKMSNMILITPFVSLIYIYFLVGEKIVVSSLVGLIFIVAGILIQSMSRRNHNRLDGNSNL